MKKKSINLFDDLTRSELAYAGYKVTEKSKYVNSKGEGIDCIEVTVNGQKMFAYKTSGIKLDSITDGKNTDTD